MTKFAYRIYGTIRGVDAATYERLRPELDFENATLENGVLDIDHEGSWVDVESNLERMMALMPESASGGVDFIDNNAWEITRYTIKDGRLSSKTFDIDNVLEHVRPN